MVKIYDNKPGQASGAITEIRSVLNRKTGKKNYLLTPQSNSLPLVSLLNFCQSRFVTHFYGTTLHKAMI